MGRRIILLLPCFRPERCSECPLCGVRPDDEVAQGGPGNKWTHWCLMRETAMSGRGVHIASDKSRHRCSRKEYELFYFKWAGRFPVVPSIMKRYQLQQTRLMFPPQ